MNQPAPNGRSKSYIQKRNFALAKRNANRKTQINIYFILEKFKNENNKIHLTKKDYEAVLDEVLTLPALLKIEDEEERKERAEYALEFAVWKLMMNGDLVLSEIEKIEAIMTHKELIQEAREAKHYSAAISGNKDLLEYHGLIRQKNNDGTLTAFARIKETAEGKEAIMIGTSAECIKAIRKALLEDGTKKKEETVIEISEGGINGSIK